jgi:hypothetical protein
MLPLVEFPTIVQHYAPFFKDVFSPGALIEFERYISGLIVSENKTVDGINRLFVVENRNQSSLNRLLTVSPFSLESLNRARLSLLNDLPGTRLKPKGVLSIDDTLLSHVGRDFEHIAKLYDHVNNNYVWAHDLMTLHYSDDETDYPLYFQLWQPVDLDKLEQGLRAANVPLREDKEKLKETAPDKWRSYLIGVWGRRQTKYPTIQTLYESKLTIAKGLLAQWVKEHPELKLPVAFDNWFTQPDLCHFLDQELHLPYVGALADSDKINLKDRQTTLKEFAAHLKQEHLEAIKQGGKAVFHKITINHKGKVETYYSYCNTHNIHNIGRVRLVINFREADLSDSPVYLISNQIIWHAAGITRIYRHRWPVEVYHEEGKEEGLDKYQLRDFGAIERHVALVAVVYSLLRAAQHDSTLREQLQEQLEIKLDGSAAFWRRVSQAQSLWCLGLFIVAGMTQGQTLQHVMSPLIKAICAV